MGYLHRATGTLLVLLIVTFTGLTSGHEHERYRINDEEHADEVSRVRRIFLDDPVWTAWGSTFSCSKSCGRGFAQRLRNCSTLINRDCTAQGGKYWDVVACNNGDCGANWLSWSSETSCSSSCGVGAAARLRNCSTGNANDCSGQAYAIALCNNGPCSGGFLTTATTPPAPTTLVKSEWSEWSTQVKCAATCGDSFGERIRICSTGRNSECRGKSWDVFVCNLGPCSVDGLWGAWTDWSVCSSTCLLGVQSRNRTCTFQDGIPRGKDCPGDPVELHDCDAGPCPVDGTWNNWGSWSVCTKTCDEGIQYRQRHCSYPAASVHGQGCVGTSVDSKLCQDKQCTVDGYWGQWSAWSHCSKSCGSGVHFKARQCLFQSGHPHGKQCTGSTFSKEACNDNPCPVDGVLSEWSAWETCSATCGGGTQHRARDCFYPFGSLHGKPCVGGIDQTQNCSQNLCPVDAVLSSWNTWSTCGKTCGGGKRMRVRTCDYLNLRAPHGQFCDGALNDTEICNINLCPLDGQWSIWSKYTVCSASCGNGTRARSRTCTFDVNHPRGADCPGPSVDTDVCNTNLCPVDGIWDAWSSWSACSDSCGVGVATRTRNCHFPDGVPHGSDCSEHSIETDVCNVFDCPTTTSTTTTTEPTVPGHWSDWVTWTSCTATCGGGTHYRERTCTYPDHTLHGIYCQGPLNQTVACKTDNCPVDGAWSRWSSWSRCSVSCSLGTRNRNRTCSFKTGYPMGEDCVGNGIEAKQCDSGNCPVDGLWSTWGSWAACPVTCDGGVTAKTRTCDFTAGSPHGNPCTGENHENITCNTNLCPVDGVLSSWETWTACTVSCGNGTSWRSRDCTFIAGRPRGNDCLGSLNQTQVCNTNLCPVDGTWTDWAVWSTCSLSCGKGSQFRARQCDFPAGVPHGNLCGGIRKNTQFCNTDPCPVDGHWTDWQAWSTCSVSCSDGIQDRVRSCVFLDSVPRGDNCSGNATDNQACNEGLCPVDGVWEAWSAWGTCTATCGSGTALRTRQCTFPDGVPHGNNCTGLDTEDHTCNTNPCPRDGVWDLWTTWSACSLSCGNGTHARNRKCDFDAGFPHGKNCDGSKDDNEICNSTPCPVDGVWSGWSNWTSCSDTCGNGTQYRLRQCEFKAGYPHGENCTGSKNDQRSCNPELCPVDGKWSDWATWSDCSKSCDNGTMTRNRTCMYDAAGAPHGAPCSGSEDDMAFCHTEQCPIDGHWSDWAKFTQCTATCGTGNHNRTRSCIYHDPNPHGSTCFGDTVDMADCNTNLCPVDGQWSDWSNWTSCSATCGPGQQVRGRVCQFDPVAPHGANCTGNMNEQRACQDVVCAVDGAWSEWSNFTDCSKTCGGGTQFRVRKCEFPDSVPHGENCNGTRQQLQTCNKDLCPVDGVFGDWTTWSTCTVTCGDGITSRSRKCEFSATAPKGDDCVGNLNETASCNNDTCPVDGVWDSWSVYGPCTKTCGGGTKLRQRNCTYPADTPHGQPCTGNKTDSVACNTDSCPVDAVWSDWSSWDACSVTCDGGMQERNRTCTWPDPQHGNFCSGNDTEIQSCSKNLCPADGVWAAWSEWTPCSRTCNYGYQTKHRNCTYDDVRPRGIDCKGSHTQSQACTAGLCPVQGLWAPWNSWANCSETCGNGTRVRDRICAYAVPGAPTKIPCVGPGNETMSCNEGACSVDAVWSDWSSWDACSVTCDGGMQERNRTCTWPDPHHGNFCSGNDTEIQSCSNNLCPADGVWAAWSEWTPCSRTCNYGYQIKHRNCTYDDVRPRGLDCNGTHTQSQACTAGLCPVQGFWAPWNSWANCSETCGNGTRVRDRICSFAVPGAVSTFPCVGPMNETMSCNDGACPVDGTWSEWNNFTDCSATCGNGTQTRSRSCDFPDGVPHGANCTGNADDTQACNNGLCPVDGVWKDWGAWSSCSVSCGGGTQTRSRVCEFASPATKGDDCVGSPSESASCGVVTCLTTTLATTTTEPMRCAICAGPADLCELSYYEQTCSDPAQRYCLNHLSNHADGSRIIDRRCATDDECYNGWWMTYSSDQKCLAFNANYIMSIAFTCEYCCTTPGCNNDINPKHKYSV